MSVRLGLLAILEQGPCYGYQLRTELDRRTGSTGPVNVGQIYNTLDRLEKAGLVRRSGSAAGMGADSSHYYVITSGGSAAVAEWFAKPTDWETLPAKIALAMTLPGVDTRSIIAVQRAFATARLANRGPSDGSDYTAALVTAAEHEVTAAELRFLDAAERMLDEGAQPNALTAELPKRGRPAKAPVD